MQATIRAALAILGLALLAGCKTEVATRVGISEIDRLAAESGDFKAQALVIIDLPSHQNCQQQLEQISALLTPHLDQLQNPRCEPGVLFGKFVADFDIPVMREGGALSGMVGMMVDLRGDFPALRLALNNEVIAQATARARQEGLTMGDSPRLALTVFLTNDTEDNREFSAVGAFVADQPWLGWRSARLEPGKSVQITLSDVAVATAQHGRFPVVVALPIKESS